MQQYFGFIAILSLILTVIVRNLLLRSQGINSVEFGKKDKNDFLLLPFAIFYLYLIFANAFNFPTIPAQQLFYFTFVSWTGVLFCITACGLFFWTLISFKKSFRVGLVDNTLQGLVTKGAFAKSRNHIYVSFAILLVGEFLIYPSWILLLYIFVAMITFHRQVLKEESFLEKLYGERFRSYCGQVRRYL